MWANRTGALHHASLCQFARHACLIQLRMLVEEDAELEVTPSGRISCSSLVACSTVLLPGQPGLGEDRVGYDDNKVFFLFLACDYSRS